MDKERLFPHLILWICSHLSTLASKNRVLFYLAAVTCLTWSACMTPCLAIAAERSRAQFFPAHWHRVDSWKTVWQWVALSPLTFFLTVFACFWEISPDFRFFCRFTIDLYIKIVVIVNAFFSVDKSSFFNKINRLRTK